MAKDIYQTVGGISTDAVKAKTGKSWAEWVAALDAEGCQKMTHKEIVAVVHSKFGIGAWWQQMVTVGYEQARGLRAKHQKADGYAVSATKTVAATPSALFKAWYHAPARRRWLPEAITITTATPGKSLRARWIDKTTISVNLYVKGENKTQVTVQHEKIATAKEAARLKKQWGQRIAALKAMLEG